MKKIISALLLVAIVFTCLCAASCSGKDKLIVYTEAGFAPWEMTEGTKVVGVDMEIAKYIADKYGYELEVIDGNFDTIVAGIDEDNALGIAGISYDTERAEKVEFSDFYYSGEIQTVVYKASASPVLNDDGTFAASNFNGKTVSAQTGTTGHLFVENSKEDWSCNVKTYAQVLHAVEDLGSAVDYLVIDSTVAAQLLSNNSDLKMATCEGAEAESYAVVAKKGNKALIEKVNVAIAELTKKGDDGKSQIDKWLEQYAA